MPIPTQVSTLGFCKMTITMVFNQNIGVTEKILRVKMH